MTSISSAGTGAGAVALRPSTRANGGGSDPDGGKLQLSTEDLIAQIEVSKVKIAIAEGEAEQKAETAKEHAREAGHARARQARATDEARSGTDAAAGKVAKALASASSPTATAPAGAPKGEAAALTQPAKVDRLSQMLEMDATELSKVSSARELVGLLQQKGVDLTALRNVLNSGDILDVAV